MDIQEIDRELVNLALRTIETDGLDCARAQYGEHLDMGLERGYITQNQIDEKQAEYAKWNRRILGATSAGAGADPKAVANMSDRGVESTLNGILSRVATSSQVQEEELPGVEFLISTYSRDPTFVGKKLVEIPEGIAICVELIDQDGLRTYVVPGLELGDTYSSGAYLAQRVEPIASQDLRENLENILLQRDEGTASVQFL